MTDPFDIKRARADTPACEERVHFNNAGASLMPLPVSAALHHFLQVEESCGGYEAVEQYQDELEGVYRSAARLLNCAAEEVAFIENATRAWDQAFYSFEFRPGDRILTTVSEYGSNVIAYLQRARRDGISVEFVPDDESGQIDVDALANLIDERVRLISISHIPTGGGLVNPAQAVGRVANEAGIPYLLDACQSAGQIPLDVDAIGCDALSLTGRKFLRGPRATGLLYMRRALQEKLEPVLLDQHAAELVAPDAYRVRDDAKKFENWEQNFAGKFALAHALDYALEWGLDAIRDRVYCLAQTLRQRLAEIDGVTLTDQGDERCGIVTFCSDRRGAYEIKSLLAQGGINVSVSDGSGTLVSFERRGLTAVVRASVHYFNTEQEIEYFIDQLALHL